MLWFVFFFQAEDGIRDLTVTGVQTCALPICRHAIEELAPVIANLYRSPALIEWLGQLAGERLDKAADDDPHPYALDFYTRAGHYIGWHHDTSRLEEHTPELPSQSKLVCRLLPDKTKNTIL